MEPADRDGIDQRRCLERARSQRDVDLNATPFGDRLKAMLRHLLDEACERISNITRSEPGPSTGTTTNIDRRLPRTNDLGQQQA